MPHALAARVSRRLHYHAAAWRRSFFIYLDASAATIPGSFGWGLRHFIFRGRAKLGAAVKIDEFVSIRGAGNLAVGDRTFIGRGCMIDANGGVTIGSDVLIAPDVKIWSADHVFTSRATTINVQGHEYAPVHIGDDTWIGVGSIILKGVRVGDGAVIGAGAVVTRDVPPFCVAVGCPARVVGRR